MSRHLKPMNAPKSWILLRKQTSYVTKPAPGPHPLARALPLSLVLKHLGYAHTMSEVKKLLSTKDILVDGRRIREHTFPVGLFDNLSIAGTQYTITLDTKGRLQIVPHTASQTKPCKITAKRVIRKGIIQVTTADGRNLTLEKTPCAVGDTILLHMPTQEIKKHLPLAPGSKILLTSGGHVGDTGTVKTIDGSVLTYTNASGQTYETRKQFAYVIP